MWKGDESVGDKKQEKWLENDSIASTSTSSPQHTPEHFLEIKMESYNTRFFHLKEDFAYTEVTNLSCVCSLLNTRGKPPSARALSFNLDVLS